MSQSSRRSRQIALAILAAMMFGVAINYFGKAHWASPASCTLIGVLALGLIPFCRE